MQGYTPPASFLQDFITMAHRDSRKGGSSRFWNKQPRRKLDVTLDREADVYETWHISSRCGDSRGSLDRFDQLGGRQDLMRVGRAVDIERGMVRFG